MFLMFIVAAFVAAGQSQPGVRLVVLGVAQDGGFPHVDCFKEHCVRAQGDPQLRRSVVCLGLVDGSEQQAFLFEATPDLPSQLFQLRRSAETQSAGAELAGIFLTHAHIGHYTGLMYLGKEAKGARGVPVFAMPRMTAFLRDNGPWSQLVELGNIRLRPLIDGGKQRLSAGVQVTPFLVPHRDEYSETVGFRIQGPGKSVLFIPDIDKWHLWESDISEQLKSVEYAFLDATFFAANELPGRDMAQIPHPFVVESLARFQSLPAEEKDKVYFIHFNHSNPLFDPQSEASKRVRAAGLHVAREGMRFQL